MSEDELKSLIKYLQARLPFQITINDNIDDFTFKDDEDLMSGLVGMTFDAVKITNLHSMVETEIPNTPVIFFQDDLNDYEWWIEMEYVRLLGVDISYFYVNRHRVSRTQRSW